MIKWMMGMSLVAILVVGCGGHREVVVDSGSYEGSVLKVNAEETEIYVALDEARVLELYFTAETTVSNRNAAAEFSDLAKGQAVRVEVEQQNGSMVPMHVTILD